MENKKQISLPENAYRELKAGEEYKPVMPADSQPAEGTTGTEGEPAEGTDSTTGTEGDATLVAKAFETVFGGFGSKFGINK